MNNNVLLVGRLVHAPESKHSSDGEQIASITVAVTCGIKNKKGEYETDFFDCISKGKMATNILKMCKKADIVGVKGHLKTKIVEKDYGSRESLIVIVADSVSVIKSAEEKDV